MRYSFRVLGSAAAVCALVLTASAASAAETLDANSGPAGPAALGDIFGPGFFNNAVAQTFTAGKPGQVSRVVLGAGWFRTPPSSLTASIVLIDGLGLPGPALGSTTLANPVTANAEFMTGPVSFDFSGAPVTLTAGSTYGILLSAASCCAGVALLSGDAYAAGQALVQSDAGLWSATPESDLQFQIYIAEAAPVPSPSRAPMTKDACKGDGWKAFTNPAFKNQGQCVAYANHN